MSSILGRFFQRHRHTTAVLHVIRHRHRWWRWKFTANCCFIGRAQWAALPSRTLEALQEGEDDWNAGRWYRYDTKTHVSTPNPDWPKDGPQPSEPTP